MRRSKLTDDLQEKILRHIRRGNYRKHAAEAAGISEAVMREWMEWGLIGKWDSMNRRRMPWEPYKSFAEAVRRAEAQCVTERVGNLYEQAAEDPKVAQWFLSKKAPHQWGDATKRTIKQYMDLVFDVIEAELGSETAKQIFDEITRTIDASPVDREARREAEATAAASAHITVH